MKYIVLSLLSASFISFAMVAVGNKVHDPSNQSYEDGLSQLILNQQIIVSGLVFKSERGTAITTNRGTFLLKGVAGELLVGKNIRVTGVIRGESLFAVKIDVMS